MSEPTIVRQSKDGVLQIGLNRPERKNAITGAMYEALALALAEADQDVNVRVVVLHGNESAFCSGNDIADFAAAAETTKERPAHKFMRAVIDLRKPLLASVNGPAVGIGATMLLHCDMVFAGSNLALVFPFVKLGLCPEFASSALLAQRVGHQRAAELFLLGTPCTADRALSLGLVNHVVAPEKSLEHAIAAALTLAKASPDAVTTTKSLMRGNTAPELLTRIQLENQQFARLLRTPQAQAAFASFMKKPAASAAAALISTPSRNPL